MNAVLEFAREELNRYCKIIFGENEGFDIEFAVNKDSDNPFRDGYDIDIRCGKGTIVGKNERSVLLGVYQTLKSIGCRFVRPGVSGEIIPRLSVGDFTVSCSRIPAYDHRGITIEGAVSEEDLRALIDWMPKAGLNSYFIQFRNGYEFYERWYRHSNNPTLPPEPFDSDRAWEIHNRVISELKKRGLIVHGVGHGWTCECLGIPSNGWHERETVPEEIRPYLAQIDGERKFFKNKPLNTQLCYSNPVVRDLLVNEVIEYAAAHREIDVLHFWLADDFNNFCECAECRKHSPADLYIRMLNEIDRKLTEAGLHTKIVFLVYLELYWPPVTETIHNPDRFIMMFAPIFRSYSRSYDEYLHDPERELLPYSRNRVDYPHAVGVYMQFLRAWKKVFSGESFDFDYHLMWDIYRDFSGLGLADILRRDVFSLRDMGLNGLLGCQVQRAFFPSPFAMNVMADSLFAPIENFDQYREKFFADVYGPRASLASEVFERVRQTMPLGYFREEIPLDDPSVLNGFRRTLAFLEKNSEAIGAELPRTEENEFLRASVEQLNFYAESMRRLLRCCIAKAEKKTMAEVMSLYDLLHDFVNENELRMSGVLDAFYYHFIVKGFLEKGEMVNYGGI